MKLTVICLILLIPLMCYAGDKELNEWLGDIPETVMKVEVLSFYKTPIWKATGYSGTLYFFSYESGYFNIGSKSKNSDILEDKPQKISSRDWMTGDRMPEDFWMDYSREMLRDISPLSYDKSLEIIEFVRSNWPDNELSMMRAEMIIVSVIQRSGPGLYDTFINIIEWEMLQHPSGGWNAEFHCLNSYVKKHAPGRYQEFIEWQHGKENT